MREWRPGEFSVYSLSGVEGEEAYIVVLDILILDSWDVCHGLQGLAGMEGWMGGLP